MQRGRDLELNQALAKRFNTRAFDLTLWAGSPVSYFAMNPVSQGLKLHTGDVLISGVYRPFTFMQKVMAAGPRNGEHNYAFEMSDDPSHWNYWKREALVYGSDILGSADSMISGPECFHVNDRAIFASIWLEVLTSTSGEKWNIERLAKAAEHIGEWQAAYINAVPDYPWLSRNWLRSLMPTRTQTEVAIVDDDEVWKNERVKRLVDPSIRTRVLDVWNAREALLNRVDRLPQTLTHYDLRPPNLFESEDGNKTKVIDWQFVGQGGVGQDLVGLIIDAIYNNQMPAHLIENLETEVLTHYVKGMAKGGVSISLADVKAGYAVTAALRFGLNAGSTLRLAADTELGMHYERQFQRPIDDLVTDQLVAVEHSLDLGRQMLDLGLERVTHS